MKYQNCIICDGWLLIKSTQNSTSISNTNRTYHNVTILVHVQSKTEQIKSRRKKIKVSQKLPHTHRNDLIIVYTRLIAVN